MQSTSPIADVDDHSIAAHADRRLQCGICDRTFARNEHLRRHTLTHTETRPFHCSICQKEFFRRDALQRHLITHQNSEPTLLQKGARACQACATAKARCSGGSPCSRCTQRAMACTSSKRDNSVSNPKSISPGTHQSHHNTSVSPQRRPPGSESPYVPMVAIHVEAAAMETGHLGTSQPPRYADTSTPSAARPGYLFQEFGFSQPRVDQGTVATMGSPLNIQGPPGVHMNEQTDLSSDQRPSVPSYLLPSAQPSNLLTTNQALLNTNANMFDLDAWNPNYLSTINWLTDATLGFDNTLSPLPLNESIYFNDFPHMFPSFVANQGMEDLEPQANLQSRQYGGGDTWIQDDARTHETVSSENAGESQRSDETRARSGQFYVDSDSSRLPRIKRRKYNPKAIEQSQNAPGMQFSLQVPTEFSDNSELPFEIESSTYDKLLQAFQRWCVTPPAPLSPFHSAAFPSKTFFDYVITLYFQSFHPVFPLLHAPTFAVSRPHWLLVLAVAGVGSQFVEMDGSETLRVSFHEFLRRMLLVAEEDQSWQSTNPILRAQIRLLHALGALYSGDERLHQSAIKNGAELTIFCQQQWLENQVVSPRESESADRDWSMWRDQELRRRAGYCAWLLDCMWTFQYGRRTQLLLEDAKVPLPCNEKLWAARSPHEWQQLKSTFTVPPTLFTAVQKLYVEKYLAPDLGEFSTTILIHGLFQRSWEVEAYFRQPLSRWDPTAKRGSAQDPQLQTPSWLPSILKYAKWRNSTCDALDVCHWKSNSIIGNASGMEHPTVAHLHLARVILLTPYNDIVKLAKLLVRGPLSNQQSEMLECEQTIRKWATQDQYKARLAMIHAGVLFWHIRRFSANGFYEPFSIALATLALWAFATFHNKSLAGSEREVNAAPTPHTRESDPNNDQQKQVNNPESDSDDPVDCDIILIDRPTDDELVQNFVRRGGSMIVHLAGVGNLYGERGPELVLQEGRKILCSLQSWGIRRQWLEIIDGLLEVTRRKRT